MTIHLSYDDISTHYIDGKYLIILTEKLKKFIEKCITDGNEISVYYYDISTSTLKNHILDSSLINKYICLPFSFYNCLKDYVNIHLNIEHVNKTFKKNIILKKTLTKTQSELVNLCYNYYSQCIKNSEPFTLLISEETGFGKTITTLGLLSKIKEKTVIFAKTLFIQDAWKDECNDCKEIDYFVSGDGVSKFKYSKNNISDILIVSINHLKNKKFIKYILSEYSLYVFDEIHNYNLSNNGKSLIAEFIITNMLKKSIYITGTPRSNCSIYYGNPISVKYKTNIERLVLFNIMENIPSITLNTDELTSLQEIMKHQDSYNTRRNGFISIHDYERNKLIIKYIEMNSYINKSRSLILTSSVEHIHKIYELLALKFKKKITKNTGDLFVFNDVVVIKFLSKKKKHISEVYKTIFKQNNLQEKKYIIITTHQFAGAGANIPGLNTLFIVCPGINSTSAKQAAGRIMRIQECNNTDILRSIYIFPITSIDKSFDTKIKKSFLQVCDLLSDSGWELKNIYNREEYIKEMKSLFIQ